MSWSYRSKPPGVQTLFVFLSLRYWGGFALTMLGIFQPVFCGRLLRFCGFCFVCVRNSNTVSMKTNPKKWFAANSTPLFLGFVLGSACGCVMVVSALSLMSPKPLAGLINEFLNRPVMAPPLPFEGKCTQVIDADTIIVQHYADKWTVHVDSVDAPDQGEKYYTQAVQFTTKSLLNANVIVKPLYVGAASEMDAWVYNGAQCFNSEIIRAGFALDSRGKFVDADLLSEQKEAMNARRGVWKDYPYNVPLNLKR